MTKIATCAVLPEVPREALRVEDAAIRLRGVVYSLESPARHHDVIRHMRTACGIVETQGPDWEQGFVLNDGRFVQRSAAASIAVGNGQISELKWPPDLYSEDLW